ncbi:MAG: hypothetical protein ACPGUV_08805 [Polyangiales bacterium]
MKHSRTLRLTSLYLAACTAACGGASAPGADDPVGASQSARITASGGGELALAGARLVVPPGALSADTTLTATVLARAEQPQAKDLRAPVYDFGPDGTTFTAGHEATLTLTADTPPPTDGAYFAATLDPATAQWVVLPESRTIVEDDGQVSVQAKVRHFSRFTIILVLDNSALACGLGDSFTPCGGDVVGTWRFTSACIDNGGDFDFDFIGCGDFSVSVSARITGQLTFEADGSYHSAGALDARTEMRIPTDCFGGIECSDLAFDFGEEGSVREDGGTCIWQMPIQSDLSALTGNWRTQGTTLFQDDQDMSYCVQGDRLILRSTSEFGAATLVAERALSLD